MGRFGDNLDISIYKNIYKKVTIHQSVVKIAIHNFKFIYNCRMSCSPIFTVSNLSIAKPSLGFAQGTELEFQCEKLAEDMGQIIIKGPNHIHKAEHGFDVVSYDPKTDVLHLWEAKSGKKVRVDDLKTFANAMGEFTNDQLNNKHNLGDPIAAKEYAIERKSILFGDQQKTGVLAQFPKDSPVRNIVENCIREGRLEYHLVGAKKTTFTSSIMNKAIT